MATKITKEEENRRKSETSTATVQPQTPSASQTSGNNRAQANTYAQNNTRYTPSASVTAANDYLKQLRDGGYNQQWSKTLDSLVNEYMGRGAFEYDPQSDALWQQAKSEGLRQGQLAMRDATAQAAALSGGYGNSYAATVGNQVYQQAVADTMALQPQYIQAAYERYRNEGDELLQKANLAQSMDDAAWNRYMTELGLAQDEADRLYQREYNEYTDAWNRDYQLGRDAVNDARYDTEWQYKLDRDAVDDQWRNTEWQYQLDRDAVNDARYDTEWQYKLDRDAVDDQWRNTEWQYQLGRDAVADEQFWADYNYRAGQNAADNAYRNQNNAYDRLSALISTTGYTPTPDELAAAGMSESEAKAYAEYFKNQATAPEEDEDFTPYIRTGKTDDNGYDIYNYGGKEVTFAKGVNPYTGKVNPDVKNGTFKNGPSYQPDNVGGEPLTKTGITDVVNGVTQNVWETPDGTKYIWDGTKNKYLIYDDSED